MSLSSDELLQLMAYADGELEEGEIPRVLALLAKSEAARQVVQQHAAVGDWVRTSGEQRADAARSDDIANAVMAEVAKLGRAPVVALDRRARNARSRDRVMAFGAFCAVAAAVSLFYLWPESSGRSGAPTGATVAEKAPPPSPGPAESATPKAASDEPAPPAPIAVAEPETQGIDVQTVESPNHPVSIFYVPAATGTNAHASSVVVWIGEE